MTNFSLFQTTMSNLMKMAQFFKRVKKTVGKGENACYEQFFLFPVFPKDLYCRHIKTRACLGKGLEVREKVLAWT